MKHKYDKKNYLDRTRFIRAQRDKHKNSDESQNTFSNRALRGMDYLSDQDNLENILEGLDNKIDQQIKGMKTSSNQRFSTRTLLSMAAAVALLLVPAYFLMQPQASPENLFAQHFEYLPSAVTEGSIVRGISATENTKAAAFAAYEGKDYPAAIIYFEQYLKDTPADMESSFYYGIALLGKGATSEAIKQLNKVHQQPPKAAYKTNAAWYLALAYLQNEQNDEATKLLQWLAEQNKDYSQEAAEILEAL